MKKWLAWIIGGVAGLAAIIYVFIILFVVTGAFAIIMPDPPAPEITYGEFPFKITYEVNGEIREIEDVVVCEYDGIESRGTAGKYRTWKAHLKSGNDEITLLNLSQTAVTDELGNQMLSLYFYWGQPEYYMGDGGNDEQDMDEVAYKYIGKEGRVGHSAIKADEAYDKYKIKLISWECAPPIENTFQ